MSAAIIVLLAVARMSGLVAGLHRTTAHVALLALLGEATDSLLRPTIASIATSIGRFPTGDEPHFGAGTATIHRAAMRATVGARASLLPFVWLGCIVSETRDDSSDIPVPRQDRQIELARILHLLGFALAGEGPRPALRGLRLNPLSRCDGRAEGREHGRICLVLPLPPSCPCLFRRPHPVRGEATLRGKSQEFEPGDLVVKATITPSYDKKR